MTEVVLFHHALGLTPGVTAFAEELPADVLPAQKLAQTPDVRG